MDIYASPPLPEIKQLRRSSLSPGRGNFIQKKPELKHSDLPEKQPVYFGKESSVRLPFIKKSHGFEWKASHSPKHQKNRSTLSQYYDVSKIQKENSALRDFIHNFHLKQEGQRVVSSLDALTNGTTFMIAGKVQRYFNQLEEYIKKL